VGHIFGKTFTTADFFVYKKSAIKKELGEEMVRNSTLLFVHVTFSFLKFFTNKEGLKEMT
jgi:hypothetical protein